jgi:hypothetical protein
MGSGFSRIGPPAFASFRPGKADPTHGLMNARLRQRRPILTSARIVRGAPKWVPLNGFPKFSAYT